MSKYRCLCGLKFKKKEEAEEHVMLFKNSNMDLHFMFERSRSQRFWDWFYKYPWGRHFRFCGGFMIYSVIIHHFKVDLSTWEAIIIGVGLGLLID